MSETVTVDKKQLIEILDEIEKALKELQFLEQEVSKGPKKQ